MSILKSWASYFSNETRSRGRGYAESGRVEILTPEPGEVFRAHVQGTQTYTVTIRGTGRNASPACDCSYSLSGSYCKHIYAALLVAERQSEFQDTLGRDFEQFEIQAPRARKRDPNRPAAVNTEAGWLKLLRSLPAGSSPAASLQSLVTSRRMTYAVHLDDSRSRRRLLVDLRLRVRGTRGWSRGRPSKLTYEELAQLDPADAEICALLQTADTSLDLTYRVIPRAAQRMLLRRMVDRGTCVLALADGNQLPLQWDDLVHEGQVQPWKPWLRGIRTDKGLQLTLELRRGDSRMAITTPHLVLTGPQGLVFYEDRAALLDDSGAGDWIDTFQEESAWGSQLSAGSLEIPEQDIASCLERLYGMSNLPPLDLPEDLGPSLDAATLVPELQLHALQEAPQPAFASSPVPGSPAPARTVSASLQFVYGPHKIDPGHPGSYLLPSQASNAGSQAVAQAPSDDEAAHAPAAPGEAAEATAAPAAQLPMRRDLQAEQHAVRTLADLGFAWDPDSQQLILSASRMPEVISKLSEARWRVLADKRLIRPAISSGFAVRSGIDWFELHGGLQFQTDSGQQQVNLPEILAAVRTGQRTITLSDGSQGLISDTWLAEHQWLAQLGKLDGDHLRFRSSQAALLDSLLNEQELTLVDARFEELRRRLRRFERVEPVSPEPSFQGELRPYQREGLGWLSFLQEFGMGGILADDMGLGKTVQVLAMLDACYASSRSRGEATLPTLIVVPRSVVFNWMNEASRFTPGLRVLSYTGPQRQSLREAFEQHDLVIASYGLVRRDIAELRRCSFQYVVLDEAQAIKNPQSQVAKAVRLLECRHRLALTGTPVENHLGDLWSIFEFLNPGMLGSSLKFAELIRATAAKAPSEFDLEEEDEEIAPVEGTGVVQPPRTPRDAHAAKQIGRALRPFILRRTKQQVLSDLPDKTEQMLCCVMDEPQRKIYDELLAHYRKLLLSPEQPAGPAGASAFQGGAGSMMVLDALLRLRQAACHPALIDPAREDMPSAKLDVLLEQLEELIEEGHKALVFSQFTSLLALVRPRLEKAGIRYAYLDGQTRDREQRVSEFQNDPQCPVFLISLKAGGLGLNLTAADYVFLLDPWWNPAVERQAIDRTHRIGQTRHVFAYRLICEDTIEQRILNLQEKKRLLADAILGEDDSGLLRHLTREDLEHLLS